MNAEVIKAMNRKNKKNSLSRWWYWHGHKVMRVVLFPIWICMWASDKVKSWLNAQQVWSEERANEILNYYIPRRSEWDAREETFHFFDNGMGWYLRSAKKYLKRKDRRFWYLFHYKIRWHLIDNYELEGFKKEKGDCSDGWAEVYFKINKEGD